MNRLLRSFLFLKITVAVGLGTVSRATDGDEGPLPPEPGVRHFTPPIPFLSPEEAQEHFYLPAGYRLELVLSEPIVKEPVAIEFDGNGRMYVAEMRTYMQDIDGTGQHRPDSRVSVHWSSKNDGVYDRHEVFIDNLVLPRKMLALDGALLVAETDTNDIYEYRDTTGDGRADKKTLFYDAVGSNSNLEHQTSGLVWAADNWIYSTYNAFRLRWTPEGFIKEPTAPNGGQWGLTQDNYGKPWFVNAGGEIGPLNFQVPIVYGNINIPDQFAPGFREVFPLVGIPDVQGGPPRSRPQERTLNHFTATCGQAIFRGDRLPDDLVGDLLIAEPVGRLIRRAKVHQRDGLTHLENAYPGSEFIRSTDPNFRPVNMTTAPDGTLYIVDMYRGIIQEGNWVSEGSYLREVVKEYGLENNFGRGRIYRLVHEAQEPGPQPRLLDATAQELVETLAHPNGWWRETAQRLLILRNAKAAAPDLAEMVRTHPDHLARFHALWTLEGLMSLEPDLVRHALADEHPEVRVAAIRASESLFKAGDDTLTDDIRCMADDDAPKVTIQVMLTAQHLGWADTPQLIKNLQQGSTSRGVREIGAHLLQEIGVAGLRLEGQEWQLFDKGRTIYQQLCFSCHGQDGQGTRIQLSDGPGLLAPPLGGSQTVNAFPGEAIRVLLHGLTGPVEGVVYPGQMVGMKSEDDEWIAAVLTYIRNDFGNNASAVRPEDVTRVREETRGRDRPWTETELRRAVPQLLPGTAGWRARASHNAETAAAATDGNRDTRFTTGTPRVPGMWFELELPAPATLTEIRLDSGSSGGDRARRLEVQTSLDGETWEEPANQKATIGTLTRVTFSPTRARYIRAVNTDRHHALWWSIHDIQLFHMLDQ